MKVLGLELGVSPQIASKYRARAWDIINGRAPLPPLELVTAPIERRKQPRQDDQVRIQLPNRGQYLIDHGGGDWRLYGREGFLRNLTSTERMLVTAAHKAKPPAA